jgi:hypothetical protein
MAAVLKFFVFDVIIPEAPGVSESLEILHVIG